MATERNLPWGPIPVYQIDLDLPPRERYKALAKDLAPQMKQITPLFDEVLAVIIPWAWLRRVIEWIASLLLRRVYDEEETAELRGIADASGLDMYLLVALNVILDSLLGCTSGGMIVKDGAVEGRRMMHFRTLDWGMDGLRNVLVGLEFVRSKSEEPESVARCVSYAGFVGVLTGVRKDLSVSLNFRPNHFCSTLSLRIHQLLVLLGIRRSIVSILRSVILSSGPAPPLKDVVKKLSETRTAPCYLILSDGTETSTIEKDLDSGTVRTASDFIIITNHDMPPLEPSSVLHPKSKKRQLIGLQDWIEESEERRACLSKKWDSVKRRHETAFQKREEKEKAEKGEDWVAEGDDGPAISEGGLRRWMTVYPVTNEMTHFRCLMEPRTGRVRFLERGRMDGEV